MANSTRIYTSLVSIALALVLNLSNPSTAQAAGIPFEVFSVMKEGASLFNSPAGKKSLLQLAERLALGDAAQTASQKELVEMIQRRLGRPELQSDRLAIEERLGELKESYKPTDAWLTEAASHLELNPGWKPGDVSSESLFAKSARVSKNFRAEGDAFVGGPQKRLPHPKPAAEELAVATRKFEFSLSKIKTCIANESASEAANIQTRVLIEQLISDEAMILGGFFISEMGSVENTDWHTLIADLIHEGLVSVADSLVSTLPKKELTAFGSTKVDFRWVVMQPVGAATAGLETIFYTISVPEKDRKVTPKSRFYFNTGWNTAYSKLSIGIFDMATGLKCMGAPDLLRYAFIGGAGVMANVVYFEARNRILGKNID